MNSKLQKLIDKKNEKNERKRVGKILSTAEKMEIAITTWHDHVVNRDEIANFITIVGNQMYPIHPLENQVLLPFEEYYGDHSMNWIIVWNFAEKREVFRKNIRNVDLIDWVVKNPEEKKES